MYTYIYIIYIYVYYIYYIYIYIIYILYIYVRLYTYVHTYIPTYIHTYIHTYLPTYLRTYVRTYIHTYIYIYGSRSKTHARFLVSKWHLRIWTRLFCCSGERARKVRERSKHLLYMTRCMWYSIHAWQLQLHSYIHWTRILDNFGSFSQIGMGVSIGTETPAHPVMRPEF